MSGGTAVAGAFLAAPTNVDDVDPSFDLVRNFVPMPLAKLPYPALQGSGMWPTGLLLLGGLLARI